ncbi:hypothetical protein NW755_003181 [Fusarium falciforme]|uniref:Uncharacterized protein n=1 Tax=Fusarium falciforme TaxID=195108 RepID=A0A9W8RCP5_9HYPO|nr:hypothetical protein NW755_003181 [Fusarium falciforme]
MSFIGMCVKVPTVSSSTSRQAAEGVQSASPVPAESSSSSPPQAGMPAHRVPPLIRLQVDFKYQPVFRGGHGTAPEELLRVFFHQTLPPITRDFFDETGKEAQCLTMFPLGESIDRYAITKYTHARLLQALVVDPDVVAGTMQVNQISNVDEYTRKLAYKRIGDLAVKAVQGRDLQDEWLALGTWLSWKAVVRVVSKSRRKTAYDRSSAAFKCYQELETAIELDCKKLFEPGAVGNQDLYLSIAQMAIAFQIVPFYRKEREQYLKRFFRTTTRIICLASPFVSFIACVYFWNKRKQFDELGWDWAMDKWAYWDQRYQYTIYWKNSIGMLLLSLLVALINFVEYHSLRFFNKRTDRKINDLRVTQGALAAKFCVRVLKMPPEIMTTTERQTVLYSLGVNFHDETPETQRRCLDAFLAKVG